MDKLAITLALCSGKEAALISAKQTMDRAGREFADLIDVVSRERAEAAAAFVGASSVRVTTPTDDLANAERTAGQIAIVQAIKGGQVDLSEVDAKALWREAALASRPSDRKWLLCDPDGLMLEYQANLGLGSWDEFRAWILSTPLDRLGI